ncbi:Leucine-responsive regulatory protein [Falsiruegeria litorea R37]|uniref:Leucine-responsive regulatory protein n=1 Tax=Falsiruegeria litorea R37 TaxID=1200284 RepID=A0A1Y5TBH5_9RHOB|nr:Lrp/AsnC family transcriptional regulator [Falsiruegeria litorea]SLN60212.1 Leucine-responsive regulatory protein [Falsiruegeria litorea R37]
MPIHLDETDKRLLDILQHNNRLTADELGERAGLSRSSVQRRLKRFRDEQIIEADISVLSAHAVGRAMTFIVEVELERERTDLLDEFRRSMLLLEDVQQCYYVTGHTDFILIVTAVDMAAYEEFSRKVFTDNPNIRRFHSNVVVNRVKVGLHVPL